MHCRPPPFADAAYREIRLSFGERMPRAEVIGYVGDHNAALLDIDVSHVMRAYPDAFFAIEVRRADNVLFPAAVNLYAENGHVRWPVDGSALTEPGRLAIQITACASGGTVAREWAVPFEVLPSLAQNPTPPARPDWMADMNRTAHAIERMYGEMMGALEACKAAQCSAEESARTARELLDLVTQRVYGAGPANAPDGPGLSGS